MFAGEHSVMEQLGNILRTREEEANTSVPW